MNSISNCSHQFAFVFVLLPVCVLTVVLPISSKSPIQFFPRMADRTPPFSHPPPHTSTSPNFLRQIHTNAPGSVQLFRILTLIVTSAILLLFTRLTIIASGLTLIFLAPIIILTSPIWIPVGVVVVFVSGSGCDPCRVYVKDSKDVELKTVK